ncbi:hypothetical protein EV421DRAFT_246329 [Armillaria borealis]|uniref:Uncharacterized protein n=1 Tax=Armillaria borealis TaxID=47425 RepID=A0AA39IUF2_9AGAR|nr:hypothetical protein EV421DRAFT_246329 [Armillaria borealis]
MHIAISLVSYLLVTVDCRCFFPRQAVLQNVRIIKEDRNGLLLLPRPSIIIRDQIPLQNFQQILSSKGYFHTGRPLLQANPESSLPIFGLSHGRGSTVQPWRVCDMLPYTILFLCLAIIYTTKNSSVQAIGRAPQTSPVCRFHADVCDTDVRSHLRG